MQQAREKLGLQSQSTEGPERWATWILMREMESSELRGRTTPLEEAGGREELGPSAARTGARRQLNGCEGSREADQTVEQRTAAGGYLGAPPALKR